ncbi:MAG: ECF-type sigma factor [bacterium]
MDAQVTELLNDLGKGKQGARDELWPIIYQELHQLAKYYMQNQRPSHTLQATALVNEAFVKLVDVNVKGQSQGQFLALAASAMRSILVDHARAKLSQKRGSGAVQLTLSDIASSQVSHEEVIYIDQALAALAEVDERMATILELKVFAGLTHNEIADYLSLSSSTVRADLRFASAWLRQKISDSEATGF